MLKRYIKYLNTKDWELIKRFSRYFVPHKKWIWLSIISIPITTAAGIAFLWVVEKMIDNYIVPGDFEGLKLYALMLSIVLALNILFDGLYTYAFSKAGGLAIMDMRKELFEKSLRFPMRYFDKNPIGVTLSRLTSDMESIAESFASGLLGLIAESFKTIALLTYLFFLNWQLTLIVLVVVPPIVLVIKFIRLKIRNAFNVSRSSLARSAAYLQESLNGIKTIQMYAAEDESFQKYDQLNKQYSDAQNRSNVYDSSLYSVVEGITSIATALVIWYGAMQVWNLNYTLGVLIVFITTLGRLFVPVKQFAQQISAIQRALSALEHIGDLFEQKTEPNEEGQAPDKTFSLQEIEFKNVCFRYDQDGPEVLKNISFKLKKGDRVALVGTTGSGKSTIIRLLSKAYTGYQGSITINGQELKDMSLKKIRDIVSVMQQDIYMFNDTVEFNISLERPMVTRQKVEEAAEFVYASHFINNLPGKYDFVLHDNASNLSKGQAQLISFARAISGNSKLIILDEATSAVDSLTEQYIQKAIENIFSKKTVIAVAHRLSTIKNSDMILVLEDGEIIERGNHTQLLQKGGKYAGLIRESSEQLS